MATRRLKIATCQFAVGASVTRNARRIRQFMQQARKARADIIHFSECALSGYAGADHASLHDFDWQTLRRETKTIMALSAKLKLWTVLGSTHRLTGRRQPHNCLYLINPRGKLVDRYDKRFCMPGDLLHYTPGDHFVFFMVNGVRCSLLICYDLRFPELYRELTKKKVDCVFQSFYNARLPARTVHSDIMQPTMQTRAATNYFWISMANSSAYYSAYASCFIQPDGKIAARLTRHRPGIMTNTVDLSKRFYDASGPFRHLALKGRLSNGPAPRDPRSRKRTSL